MTHADELNELIAEFLKAHGYVNVETYDPHRDIGGHVGWGGKFIPWRTAPDITRWTFQQIGEGTAVVTVDSDYYNKSRGYGDLGYALEKGGRTGSTMWRIAEGYINGFPLHHILWYIMTRRWGWFAKTDKRGRQK